MLKEIIIGCDNIALKYKNEIVKFLEKRGIKYTDVGVTDESDKTMYPEIAGRVSQGIIASGYKKEGILICGTGIGMAIAANKFKGIYAAVCHDIYSAERARLSNNTNIITFGARVIGIEHAKKILLEWLQREFKDSPSTAKINEIKKIEELNYR